MLRQRESPSIVDEPGWNLNSIGDLGSHWSSQPRPGDVDDDAGRALLGVVETWHAHSDRPDGALSSRRGPSHLDQLRQHPGLAVFSVRRHVAARDQARLAATELDHRPFDVRAAHVDAGVKRCHRLHATDHGWREHAAYSAKSMSPILLHGRVLTPQDDFPLASVLIDGERIAWVREGKVDVAGATRIAEAGDTVVPGFIDLQVNGVAGHDARAGTGAIESMSASLPRFGVTGFVPTLISRPIGEGVAFVGDCATAESPGARVLGAHVEGPFLNPKYRGAHDPACLVLPTPEHVARFVASPPLLMTLAPELPGALEAIRALTGAGVTVSAGHSGASLGEAQAGFDAGVRFGTHLFNAMAPMHHRDPALPGALLGDERITVGLIADGVHVHRSMLSVAIKVAGPGRTIAGRDVFSDGTSVRLADGTLAGSAATMDHLVRVMAGLPGVDLRQAVEMASTTPARAIGIDDRTGSIRPGAQADLVVLDAALQVRLTLVGGRIAYQR